MPLDPPPLPGAGSRRFLPRVKRLLDAFFGTLAIIVGLAIISAVPILNLVSLGYLLEASARVAKSGRFRDGLIGVSAAALFGKIVVACWLLFLPVRLLYSQWKDAELISPGSSQANGLQTVIVLVFVLAVFHISWALIRGGRLRHFLWPAPVRFLRWMAQEKQLDKFWLKVKAHWKGLNILHFFLLGAKGFVGAAIWLLIPVLLLIGAAQIPLNGPSFLVSLLGGILLGAAVLLVPFLQTRFALSGDFREFFRFREARASFKRAPLAFWLALFCTVLFALPLYILKIELTPKEIMWLSNIVFVIFIFPARLLVGWAVFRSEKQENARIWVSRWIATIAALPVIAVYAFIVWLTQYLSWHGTWSILEQHAFLVPAPLIGL